MKKLFLFLFFVLVFQALQAEGFTHDASLIKWHNYSQETFVLAKKENKPIFMVIAAEWCYACKLYDENTLEAEEVAEFLNENFVSIFVDFDREKEVSGQYVMGGTPTTVVFSPEGEKLIAIPGYIPKEDLLMNLKRGLPHFRAGNLQESKESVELFTYKKLNFSAAFYSNSTAVPLAAAGKGDIAKVQSFLLWAAAAVLLFALGMVYRFLKESK